MMASSDFEGHARNASLVVSHGGPGSIMPRLKAQKRIVLVPRQRRYGEHVDDHQVAFCRRIGESYGVPVVENISELGGAIRQALTGPPPSAGGDDRVTTALQHLSMLIADMVRTR
jgi:UDP-N-acetylglucosamine transferase subunit ALG13